MVEERVYLSTDKNFYEVGESIYFSAAILDAAHKIPFINSNLLHVVLLDINKQIVWKGKFNIQQAAAAGTIELKDDTEVATGVFYLAATTVNSKIDLNNVVPIEIVEDKRPRFVSKESFVFDENGRDLSIELDVWDQYTGESKDITVKMMIAKENGYPRFLKEQTEENGKVFFKLRNYQKYRFDRIEFLFLQDKLKSTKVVQRLKPDHSRVQIYQRSDKLNYANNDAEFTARDRWGLPFESPILMSDDNGIVVDTVSMNNGYYTIPEADFKSDTIYLNVDDVEIPLLRSQLNPAAITVKPLENNSIHLDFETFEFSNDQPFKLMVYHHGTLINTIPIAPNDITAIVFKYQPYMKRLYMRLENDTGDLVAQYLLNVSNLNKGGKEIPQMTIQLKVADTVALHQLFDWSNIEDGTQKHQITVSRVKKEQWMEAKFSSGLINKDLELDSNYIIGEDWLKQIKYDFADIKLQIATDNIEITSFKKNKNNSKTILKGQKFTTFGIGGVFELKTDNQGKAVISHTFLQNLNRDDKMFIPLHIGDDISLEVRDFHENLQELVDSSKLDFGTIHRKYIRTNEFLDPQTRTFILKTGQLDQIDLQGSNYIERPQVVNTDYVCESNILNCESHGSGRKPIHNETYLTLVESGAGYSYERRIYQDKRKNIDSAGYVEFNGVSTLLNYDNMAKEELSDSFYDQRSTIYWQPFRTYRSEEMQKQKIKTSDVEGYFIARLQWFDAAGQNGVCTTLINAQ